MFCVDSVLKTALRSRHIFYLQRRKHREAKPTVWGCTRAKGLELVVKFQVLPELQQLLGTTLTLGKLINLYVQSLCFLKGHNSTSCLPSSEKCSEINGSVCPLRPGGSPPLCNKLPLKSVKGWCVCEGKQGPWPARRCVDTEETCVNHFYFLGKMTSTGIK